MADAIFTPNTELASFNEVCFKTAEVVTAKMIIHLRGYGMTLAFPCEAN
ncbi:MAG: hypothetical protein AAFR03_07480 [Pseudomonadota bacterium]